MGRLKALPPLVGALPSRTVYLPGDQKVIVATGEAEAPWRAWYRTKRWAELKMRVHVRDSFTCQRTGMVCTGRHPAPNSPVANHKRPHRGDPALFWDEDNVETVMKSVHDGEIQREEQAVPRGRWD